MRIYFWLKCPSNVFLLLGIPCFACLLMLFASLAPAYAQESLPQSDGEVTLAPRTREALRDAFTGTTKNGVVTLSDQAATLLIKSLPDDFRDSCTRIEWLPAEGQTASWTVRVLYSSRSTAKTDVVLALRCGGESTPPKGANYDYDERPVVVALSPGTSTLTLVPTSDCTNCDDLYEDVEFSRAFTAAGARLVALSIYHTSENPCCGGADWHDGEQLEIIALPEGKKVLTVDQTTQAFSGDDSVPDGDIYTDCQTKIDYLRDAAGNVKGISTETHCTQNKKPLPDIKRQSFRWNAAACRFDEMSQP